MSLTSTATTFTPFMRLPTELRIQIWTEALPSITPVAFYYNRDCWKLLRTSDSDDTEYGRAESSLEFDYNLLKNIPLEIPLFWVCHEARAVVETWLQKQGDLHAQHQNGKLAVSQIFDPSRDVLYIPPATFDAFREDVAGEWEIGEGVETTAFSTNPIKTIAVHAQILEDSVTILHFSAILSQWFPDADRIFMIVSLDTGNMPELTNDEIVQGRWEFDVLPTQCDQVFYQKAMDLKSAIWTTMRLPGSPWFNIQPMEMKKR